MQSSTAGAGVRQAVESFSHKVWGCPAPETASVVIKATQALCEGHNVAEPISLSSLQADRLRPPRTNKEAEAPPDGSDLS